MLRLKNPTLCLGRSVGCGLGMYSLVFCLLLVGRLFLHGSVFCFDCFCGFRQSRFCGFAGALAGTAPALALGEFCRRAGCCSVFSRNFCLCRCVFRQVVCGGCCGVVLDAVVLGNGLNRCCLGRRGFFVGRQQQGCLLLFVLLWSLWGLCSRSCRFFGGLCVGLRFLLPGRFVVVVLFLLWLLFPGCWRVAFRLFFALAAAGGFVVVACAVAGFLFGLCNGALVQILFRLKLQFTALGSTTLYCRYARLWSAMILNRPPSFRRHVR